MFSFSSIACASGAGAEAGTMCERQQDTPGRLRQLRQVPLPDGRGSAAVLHHASPRAHQFPVSIRVSSSITDFKLKTLPSQFSYLAKVIFTLPGKTNGCQH